MNQREDFMPTAPADPDLTASRQAITRTHSENEQGTAILKNGADVTPECITWLWNPYLAAGKIHILAGPPGVGKTTCALRMLASISSGGPLPDGTTATKRDVMIWTGEDGIADTLAPRLLAMKADMRKVHFVDGARDAGGVREFDPAHDIPLLDEAISRAGLDLGMVLLDPIVSTFSGDSHKNAEVRRSMQPVADLARRHNCAVVGITHFSKGTQGRDPTERVNGSIAVGAVARVVMVCAKLPEDSELGEGCVFMIAKSNIGLDTGGFRYHLEQVPVPGYTEMFASVAVFDEGLDATAREILRHVDASPAEDKEVQQDITSFLRDLLADRRVDSKQVEADVRGAGYSMDKARRAAKKLGVVPKKYPGMKSGWYWELPKFAKHPEDGEVCTPKRLQTSQTSEDLGANHETS